MAKAPSAKGRVDIVHRVDDVVWTEIDLLRREFESPHTGLFIINGGRNSYDPVEILAKKLRKLNETNILVITILESQKLS